MTAPTNPNRGGRPWLMALTLSLALAVLGPRSPAEAAHAGYLDVGTSNAATNWTQLSTSKGIALYLFGPEGGLYAVGTASGNGPGVWAYSYRSDGVVGSGARNGVWGRSWNYDASGVYGENLGGGYGTAGRSTGVAVWGDSTGAYGIGVQGNNHEHGGIGVYGAANGEMGIGVYAYGASTALSVNGKAHFSRSGIVTIPAGNSSATSGWIMLDGNSMILATLQDDRPGIWVRSAVANSGGSAVTIHLNAAVGQDTRVVYFVLE